MDNKLNCDRHRIFFSARTQRTGKGTRFCAVRMLIRFLWTRPEEQASKRTLRGIMDDAVDSLRENDSYGSLARFVEVDRRRLRISKLEAEGLSIFQSTKSRDFATVLARIRSRMSSPSWTTLYPNVLLMNLTFQTSLELLCRAARPVVVATPASALLSHFFFLLGASQDSRHSRHNINVGLATL